MRKGEVVMEKRRVFAWIALVFFIAIVVNILYIHVYVTESAIAFMLYFLFFFFVRNKNSFLYSSGKLQNNELSKDNEVQQNFESDEDNLLLERMNKDDISKNSEPKI